MQKEEQKHSGDFLKEVDAEIEGKLLSQTKIKDIACSSNCLFLTTGNDKR